MTINFFFVLTAFVVRKQIEFYKNKYLNESFIFYEIYPTKLNKGRSRRTIISKKRKERQIF